MSDQNLNDAMEFDHPVWINEAGEVGECTKCYYAPDLYGDDDEELKRQAASAGWELLSGFSGQDRYSGPVMHPSEFIGGGLEDYIRENAGIYVVTAVSGENEPDPENPDEETDWDIYGWVVCYREA